MALLSDLINKVKKRKDEVLTYLSNKQPNSIAYGLANKLKKVPVNVELPTQHAPERFISNVVSKALPLAENIAVGMQRGGLGYAENKLAQFASLGSKVPNINLRTGTTQRIQTPKINLIGLTGSPVTTPNPTAQRFGEVGTGLAFNIAEIVGAGGAIKKLPAIANVRRSLGTSAGKILAGNTLKTNPIRFLAGKGVANVSQGMPYTLAWQALNSPENRLKEGALDVGIDLALGSLPVVGAVASRTNLDNQLVKKVSKVSRKNADLIEEAKKYKSVEEFLNAKINAYHGSPNQFDKFSYKDMGKHGTSEGYGFYFTDKKDVAQGYFREGGVLKEAYVNIKKPLSNHKMQLSSNDLKKFIRGIDPKGDGYLSNWGDVKYEGYENVLNTAVKGELSNTDNSVDLITSIINANGKNPAHDYQVLKKTLGYDGIVDTRPGWGNDQTIRIAFDNEQILTKQQLIDIYNQARGNVDTKANLLKTLNVEPQQTQSIKLNLKALPEPRGMVGGDGFVMYNKDYQNTLKQGGKTIKVKQPLKSTEKVFRLIERQEKPAQMSLQAEILKHQDPDIAYRIWRLKEDRIKASPIFQYDYVKSLMNKLDDNKQTPQQLSTTLADIEKRVYGSSTPSGTALQRGTKSGAGLISNFIRKGEAGASGVVGRGLQSENTLVRNVSRFLQGFAGGLGKTRQATEGIGAFRGSVDYAQKISHDTQQYIAELVGKDTKSLERIHAVLDPDLAKVKVSFDSLTPKEKEATEFLRQVSDYINDTNYKNGFISEELWQSHRGGKYLARAYEPFDYAPEIADFLKQSRIKMDLAPFKQRTDVNDWKVDNAIRDPAYLVAKRLQQTMFNDEVLRTFNWLKGTDMVSQTPKAGFVQLSDHKSYGELAGKFIRKDVLDDIKGLYFVNDFSNKVYDVLRAYDRNPIRQTQKQILTIFNPAVRLGNNFGNFFFAHLNGINPVTFAKNRAWASTELEGNGQLYRRMIKDGLLGTDTMKADIVNFAQKIQAGYKDDNVIKKVIGSLQTRYGNADDVAKLSAMKTWLDRGYSYEESARRVYNGFQNYRTVGWLYDIGSKLPIFGNPFVRFQGDLQRIVKNSLVDHPIRAVSTLMMWKLFTDIMSTASGETPEDRATRESRVGAPRVPFTKISLEVQTPWGAVNAGRLLGYVSYTPVGGATVTSDLARVMPIQLPDIGEAQKKNNPRIALKNLGSAPDIGPVLSVLADTDFRGKSISDPNQNRYQNSLLSDDEKRYNQLNFLARQYIPYLDDVQDTIASIKGEKDYYGRTKTPMQALLRAGLGLKVENFGAKEAQETRARNQSYDKKANEAINKSINAVKKQLLKGEIDESTANKRIQFFKKQQVQQGTDTTGVAFAGGSRGNYIIDGDKLTYLKDNGDLDSIDLNLEVPAPKQTGNTELDKKRRSAYYGDITAKINDVVKLNELGVLTDDEAEALITDLQNQKKTFQDKNGGGSGSSGKKIKITSSAKIPSVKLTQPKMVKLDILKNTSNEQKIKLPIMQPPKPQSPKKTVSVRSLAKAFEKYK